MLRTDAPTPAPLRKIGVLTFHRCFNYGSYWQARCLVEGLRAAGHEAELLDHECRAVERAEARCLLQPTLPERSRREDLPAYKRKGRRFVEAIGALPRSRGFSLHQPEAVRGYDAIVVGSDEVWNFSHPWYGHKRLFFADGLAAPRIVSYAASFGNHDAASGMAAHYADWLGGFTRLSVRDDNSAALVAQAVGAAPEMVLDPCLQFPVTVEREEQLFEPPYAIVYGHGFPTWLATAARAWARDAGMRLVSIGYRNAFADEQRLDLGPQGFAEAMAGASAVITNFFHGSVFALVNDTPLVGVPSPYRLNKMRDLAGLLGWQERLLTDEGDAPRLTELLACRPGPHVQDRIARLRVQSSAFLDSALG